MVYQSLKVIQCQILFIHLYQVRFLTHYVDNIFLNDHVLILGAQLNGFKYSKCNSNNLIQWKSFLLSIQSLFVILFLNELVLVTIAI